MSKESKELLQASLKRRTYRQFLSEPVDLDTIKDCILTAGTAPNGANKQPWHFSVIISQDVKDAICDKAEEIEKTFYEEKISKEWQADLAHLAVNYKKPFLREAPCLIAIFRENYKLLPDGTKDKNYYPNESTGLATGLLINALRHAGYATLTYTPAPMSFVRDILNRPAGETPVMILVVGKADPDYPLPAITKKPFEEIADIV